MLLLLSSGERTNEFVRVGGGHSRIREERGPRPMPLGPPRFPAPCNTATVAYPQTHVYTSAPGYNHGRSWFSRVNYRAAVYRDHRRVIVPAIGAEQSRVHTSFPRDFLPFLTRASISRIALLMIRQFCFSPIGYVFKLAGIRERIRGIAAPHASPA